jgi:hypothetical protein
VSEVTDPREDELQLPVGWHDWPDANKIEYLRLSVSREAQLDEIRRAINSDRDSARFDKRELAEIMLAMGVA